MKANADKCHLLVSSDENCTAKIEDFSIKNSTKENLLGVKFDSNLSFENHVISLCKKASQKLHALARISHYMDLNKRRNLMKAFITSQFSQKLHALARISHYMDLNKRRNLMKAFITSQFSQKLHALARISHYMDLNKHRNLMKAFITSQFSYCALIWMFHSSNLNKINRKHERALRLIYQNNLNFSELLDLHNSVTVHQKNLQILVTEIYKVKNGIAPEMMKDIFELQNPSYNLRSSCNRFRRKHKNC